MTDCRQRVARITLEVEPDNNLWGFPEMLDAMRNDPEVRRIEAVIELVREDFMGMFEDAVWTVEFSDDGQQ